MLDSERLRRPYMIIITGASVTGKTVISKSLSTKFNLPALNKDEI